MQPKNRIVNQLPKLLPLLLAVSWPGLTATAFAAPPDSAAALEGTKTPAIQKTLPVHPEISVQEEQATPLPPEGDSQTFTVSAFRFSGSLPVSENALQSLLDGKRRGEMTLQRLTALASAVTEYLRQQGYLVAFAYIPAQEIKDGIVEIAVIPGKYGQVKISGDGHIGAERLKAMLFCAKPGMIITRAPLERALLLINDLSGVTVKATLSPGQEAGTADLILETTDTAKTGGALYADNWGNSYTGRTRYGTQITINNLSDHYGDALTLGGLTTSDGINNYTFGYSAPLGHDGAKAEVKYSHIGYTLGEEFADLGATGRAAVTSYSVSYPFIRSRSFNLYGTVGYDVKHLKDDIAGYGSYSPRTSGLWNLGLSGSFADTWLGGGNNAFSLTHYRGNLDINDAAARTTDASTAQTSGNFSKTALTYQRQQYVAQNLNFNFSFTGQLADKNLDSSEKLYLGGADGVRSYPQGEASGDQGYKLTGELRWRLPGLSSGPNNLYLNTFYDYGNVMINKHPYSTDDNRRSLMAAGLGLLWTRDRDFAIRMDYAWKLGGGEATGDRDKSGRFWLQGVKYF